MSKTIYGTTRDAIKLSDAIDDRANYRTNGALSGEYMPESRDMVARYVIRSYDEVIAVFTYYDRWATIVSRKFTVTTSRHTTVARNALNYSAKHVHTLDSEWRLDADGDEYK